MLLEDTDHQIWRVLLRHSVVRETALMSAGPWRSWMLFNNLYTLIIQPCQWNFNCCLYYDLGNMSAILSLQSPPNTPAITSCLFFNSATTPVPYMSTDFGRRAFSYSSPATWNSINTSIRNCSSLYSFKRHLKSHLIAQLINNNTLHLATWCLPAPPIHA